VKFTFPYSFAIGWILVFVILSTINKLAEKKLFESEFIRNIPENQLNELMIRFDLRTKNYKRKKIVGYVAFAVLTIGVFIASYYLSK
jgi:SNF family Na+-dependent transporter